MHYLRAKKKNILIGEDNLGDIALIKQILKELNFEGETHTQQTGPKIRDYLLCEGDFADRDIRQQPTLVLLDLNIPQMSGLQVLQKIKTHRDTCRTPMIMMSSGPHPKDIADAYRYGCGGFLIKPYDYDDFRAQIAATLAFWGQGLWEE